MGCTNFQIRDDVAILTLNNPPVNGLSFELRSSLVNGIDRAIADSRVRAVVLVGNDRAFSGGADIREFGTPLALAEPSLRTVICEIEACRKPVIAAVGGLCLGGGLELAMGCHYRIAIREAVVGLPEVKLGLLPGAGGTQRLPRLIGAEAALNMILSGATITAGQAEAAGMFDSVIEGDLLEGALAFAREIVRDQKPLQRVRDLTVHHPNAEAFFQFARNAVGGAAKSLPAPRRCIDAVAASVSMSFDDGLRVERDYFVGLLGTPESKALRHAFFSERAAAKVAGLSGVETTRPIDVVGVIGAGTMGSGIAMNFLSVGIPVVLLESKQEMLEHGTARIRGNYENLVRKGMLSKMDLDARMALLRPTLAYGDLGEADLIIEAVFEDMEAKQNVFRRLDEVAKPGAILATNTSTLDVNRIAAITQRPQDIVGLHFFSPANVMRLLEVVRGDRTGADVLATVMRFAQKIGKTAVLAGVCDGFIGNRMLFPYSRQAGLLLEEGATPWQIDRALEKWGMAMGPFRMGDLAGNDIGWVIRKRHQAEAPGVRYSRIPDMLCEMGRFGQKTGAGWYTYEGGRRNGKPDPAVDDMIVSHRNTLGISARRVSDKEIVERCIYALVNEGARILEDGIAQRASDIDVVYLSGYGFPRQRGGPMFYADEVGLYGIARTMDRFARESGDPFWQPAALVRQLAAEGKTFNGTQTGA
ncbi:3-hydroxyacyl-CoA dehydrogenase NAD-binding domain-containing protein [Castellaniella sp. GW247-6E4]|uniref:3-hydroxyacyl-CoA dehydrogenase NAD-binding domain-containing protein n=1 Tax=Castellaniella sp. GW247-6E4 TaxID=3140380 RepID=UPI00331646E6